MKRIGKHEVYIRVAKVFSQRGTCGRLQVGAIAVRDGRIIASSYNGPPPNSTHCTVFKCDLKKSCTRAIHAEANLIAWAAREGIKIFGATLYITHSPCIKCAELILQAGIKEVYYQTQFRETTGLILLTTNGIKTTKIDEVEDC